MMKYWTVDFRIKYDCSNLFWESQAVQSLYFCFNPTVVEHFMNKYICYLLHQLFKGKAHPVTNCELEEFQCTCIINYSSRKKMGMYILGEIPGHKL